MLRLERKPLSRTIVSVAYRFGRLATGGKFHGTRCFVAEPTLQARSLPEKSYARGALSEYKGGPCVILHRWEQCAVKHRRSFPVSRTNMRSKPRGSRESLLIFEFIRVCTRVNRSAIFSAAKRALVKRNMCSIVKKNLPRVLGLLPDLM